MDLMKPNGNAANLLADSAAAHVSPSCKAELPQAMQVYELVHWTPSRLLPVRQDKRARTGTEYQEYFGRFTEDVKARGIVQPIIAIRKGEFAETVDGETRRLAALVAGLLSVPVLLYEKELSESELIVAQLQANEMRREFTDLERAEIYAKLMQLNGWSQTQLALNIHVSPARVSKVLAVSNKLPDEVRAMIGEGDGKIPPSSAYQLSRLPTAELMRDLANKIIGGHLKRDRLETEIAKHLHKQSGRKKPKPVKVIVDGITLVFTEHDLAKLASALAILGDALKKLQRHGLPLASLSWLLKSTPETTPP